MQICLHLCVLSRVTGLERERERETLCQLCLTASWHVKKNKKNNVIRSCCQAFFLSRYEGKPCPGQTIELSGCCRPTTHTKVQSEACSWRVLGMAQRGEEGLASPPRRTGLREELFVPASHRLNAKEKVEGPPGSCQVNDGGKG